MNYKRISATVLSLIILFSSVPQQPEVSAAKSITELKQALAENTKKKQEAIKAKAEKQQELNSVSDKKGDLDIQISSLQSDIDAIDEVINQKEQEIENKTRQIDELTEQIDESKDILKERMKIMYENGNISYLELIFESKGLSDLFTRIAIIQDIVEHDRTLIQEYVDSRTDIEEAKVIIENEQKEQKEAKSLLEDKKTDMKAKQAEYDKLMNTLKNEVAELEKFCAENEKYEEQARAELQKAMEAQEAANKSKSSSSAGTVATAAKATKGEFGWPSASSTRITSEFSPNRKNPVTGVWRAHKGMDIGAPQGSDVLASKDGTVVTAKWNNGYGYYITINHGNGIATLYAHNSKLLVKAGDVVKKGQVIAKVGSTGNSTGPHIHFEVIVNGTPQNPRNYL